MIRKKRILRSENLFRGAFVDSSWRRLRDLASTFQMIRVVRVMGPAVVALSLAGATQVCAAQTGGTMDFTGAQTLMTTFNMGASAIQSQVEISECLKVIAKQLMSAFQCERTSIRDLKQCFEGRVFVGTRQVRQEVPCCSLSSFVRTDLTLLRRFDPTMKVSDMNQGINDSVAGNSMEHHQEFTLKGSTWELLAVDKERSVVLPAGRSSHSGSTDDLC